MSLIELASNRSLWRGVYYYEDGLVMSFEKVTETIFAGKVRGNHSLPYNLILDISHQRKSTCTCPFAEGRRVICKHMIALYFTIFPDAYENFMKEVAEWELEEAESKEEHVEELRNDIAKLSRKELQDHLLNAWLEMEELRGDSW